MSNDNPEECEESLERKELGSNADSDDIMVGLFLLRILNTYFKRWFFSPSLCWPCPPLVRNKANK